jgi:hypothetical protein
VTQPTPQDDPNWTQYPPEVQQQLIENFNRFQIQADDYRHSILRFISEADYDHLVTVRNMMHNITWAARPDIFSAHYEGWLAMELQKRFNICAACNVDHDKELQAGHPSVQGGDSPESPDQPIEELTDAGKVFVNSYGDLTEADIKHMELYNLDDLRNEEDNDKLVGFICLNCGMQYPSIEDRMREPADPGGCSGCRQKAKFG